MGYVTKQLADGERVVHSTTLHRIIFLAPALIVGVGVGMLWIESLTALFFLFLVAPVAFTSVWIRYTSSEFAVTDRRVIIKVGLITRKKTMEMSLTKVESVQVDQTITGRMLNYGTIVVTGTGGTKESFKLLRRPLEFRQHVQEGASGSHVAAAKEHLAALGPSADAGHDIADQIARLGELRTQGLLTDEEFEQQKQKLLPAS